MCTPARCRSCSKSTWTGCGQHVDQVMRHIPPDRRCTCAAGTKPQGTPKGGRLSRIFGR